MTDNIDHGRPKSGSETDIATLSLDFTAQPAIPPAGVARANELMASGRLFRYGEFEAEELDVAELERAFAASVGARFAVAFNSCGAALAAALHAVGVQAGNRVLMNAFTLAPVPGSIARLGASPLYVETTPDLVVDLEDLERKAKSGAADVLLLSHMRGHISDMDAVAEICQRHQLTLLEDCAHTMGAGWNGRPTGTYGLAGCFSTQTFKHINSGEGGLLVTDDDDVAARAILYSGSYMLYRQHGTVPPDEAFSRHRATTPNCSSRMSALAAAVARPQLDELPDRADRWNARYRQLEQGLGSAGFVLPRRPVEENFVASSIQFDPQLGPAALDRFVELADEHGVAIKWFGREQPTGFTSRFDHWRYAGEQSLPQTTSVLAGLCDMRIPLAMTREQAGIIINILIDCRHLVTAAEQ
jgi:dTDP-4-amino-4,6-dideoxygalactose transaminase